MVENESYFLQKVNKKNIGPKYVDYNLEGRFVVYKYFDAKPLNEAIKEMNKKQLKIFIKDLIKQAKTLDNLGVDHGQLAGRGTNILVLKNKETNFLTEIVSVLFRSIPNILKNKKPIIVDFEKASESRKVHNYNVLKSFLFDDYSLFALEVKKILGKNEFEKEKKTYL